MEVESESTSSLSSSSSEVFVVEGDNVEEGDNVANNVDKNSEPASSASNSDAASISDSDAASISDSQEDSVSDTFSDSDSDSGEVALEEGASVPPSTEQDHHREFDDDCLLAPQFASWLTTATLLRESIIAGEEEAVKVEDVSAADNSDHAETDKDDGDDSAEEKEESDESDLSSSDKGNDTLPATVLAPLHTNEIPPFVAVLAPPSPSSTPPSLSATADDTHAVSSASMLTVVPTVVIPDHSTLPLLEASDFSKLFARLGMALDAASLAAAAVPLRLMQSPTPTQTQMPTQIPTLRGTVHWPAPLPLPPAGEEANASRLAVLLRGGVAALATSDSLPAPGRPRPLSSV